jgi:hypothetical protein
LLNGKNYIVIIVPYLTLCCGLYQITYWRLFNLNAFNLISISDIIKSSISPLLLSFLVSAIGLYLAVKLSPKTINLTQPKNSSSSKKRSSLILIFMLFISVALLLSALIWLPGDNYKVYAMIVGSIVYIFTDIDFVFEKNFNPRLNKKLLLMIMIYFPFISIAKGLEDGYTIILNKSYQYTIFRHYEEGQQILRLDTVKMVGFSGEKFILTGLKNDNIVFLKVDALTMFRK